MVKHAVLAVAGVADLDHVLSWRPAAATNESILPSLIYHLLDIISVIGVLVGGSVAAANT